ncbi:MAG: hypothetical protein IT210_23805 [Armatimonadetes bacterium]|nr:hypothetical protein [Armatimonadota bacterium]
MALGVVQAESPGKAKKPLSRVAIVRAKGVLEKENRVNVPVLEKCSTGR